MNHFVLEQSPAASPCDVVTSITRLLDTGAEFAKFSIGQPHRRTPLPIWMARHTPLPIWITLYTSSVEFVDGNLNLFRGFPSADLVL